MRASPHLSKHSVDGVDLAVWEWAGDGPTLLLCHATGFHARCWDRVVARLEGRHVVALDFRGHGQSAKPEPPYRWRSMAEDLAQLARQLNLRDTKAAGHSMGGHAVALAAALYPEAFASLLLLDPVILPEQAYTGAHAPLEFVLKRRNHWSSPSEMFERYRNRAPFQTWDPAVLRDYCDHGLNGAVLACPPAVEASIYANSAAPGANIYPEIERVRVPVHVVRSRAPYSYGTFAGSPTAPDLAARFPNATDEHRKDVSHFIPMEAPALTAELILGL